RQMPEAWLPGACMTADGSTVVRVDPIKGQNGQWRISLLDTLTGTQGSSRILHMADWFGRGVSPTGEWLTTGEGYLLHLMTRVRGVSLAVGGDEAIADVISVSSDGRLIAGRLGEIIDSPFAKPGRKSLLPKALIRVWESASGRELLTFASPDECSRA